MRIGRPVARVQQEDAGEGPRSRQGRMRIGRRIARVLFWGVVLCLSSLVGGIWFLYWHITDSDTISKVIREYGVRYFPTAILDPGRIRPSILKGELVFHDFRLRQPIDGTLFETLRMPFLQLRVNARKLAEGVFEPRDVVVGQPTLRLRARRDGTWNLQGLIADPWPGPWIETPPINIRNGTVELYPCEEPAPSSDRPSDDARGKLASATGTGPPIAGGPRKPTTFFAPRQRFRHQRAMARSTRARRSCATSASRSSRLPERSAASNSKARPVATALSGWRCAARSISEQESSNSGASSLDCCSRKACAAGCRRPCAPPWQGWRSMAASSILKSIDFAMTRPVRLKAASTTT